eukprot:6054441-Lingulodinium_polyedra.AAC.1
MCIRDRHQGVGRSSHAHVAQEGAGASRVPGNVCSHLSVSSECLCHRGGPVGKAPPPEDISQPLVPDALEGLFL